MIESVRKILGSIIVTLTLLVGVQVFAADAEKPVGKVSIEEKQFGLLLGGSTGSGILTFHGKKIPFELKGLSAGLNVGVSKMSAAGEVYALKDISQFPGTYTKVDAAVAVGGGAGALHLKNENGVVMTLHSRTKGLDVNLGSISGLTVTLK
jgi:hypothetical protein